MKSRKAYAAVGMLLTLLIIAIMYILFMPSLKKMPSGGGIFSNPTDVKSAEERAQDKINEIERLRQQAAEEYEKNSQGF